MKKILLVGAVLFTLVGFTSSAVAAGYGEAGCGLGSVVFQDSDHKSDPVFQMLAATTNNLLPPFGQLFGITSGTSNCNDSLMTVEKEREFFAAVNFSSLVKEMAMGEGENLDVLASLYGCSQDQFGSFGTAVQGNFGSIVTSSDTDSQKMLTNLNQVLSQDAALQSCTGIIG